MIPDSLQALIDMLKLLPGVGNKTAERYALHLLELPEGQVVDFSQSILHAKQTLKSCETCHMLSDHERCSICLDAQRNQNIICVVPSVKEVFTIEKTGEYRGVYHVLGGLISTQKGILPQDLEIESLLKRISAQTEEVILALNATVEGEMTSLYLAKRMDAQIAVTRLAFGLPIGGQLDYADELTLLKAFEGRQKVK